MENFFVRIKVPPTMKINMPVNKQPITWNKGNADKIVSFSL